MAVAKEQIRQIISEDNISSVADVYSLLKESFKDILQELMEVELYTRGMSSREKKFEKLERRINPMVMATNQRKEALREKQDSNWHNTLSIKFSIMVW